MKKVILVLCLILATSAFAACDNKSKEAAPAKAAAPAATATNATSK